MPIHRPEDYFAEMVKTDDHMRKVNLFNNITITLEMFTCINFCTGKREFVESAESLGAQGEIQKAQRTQKIWKEGINYSKISTLLEHHC